MSKTDYSIKRVTKEEAATLLLRYHYLKDISRGFKSGYNYGLYLNDTVLVGVIIFTGFPVPELSKGMLGLERNQQDGLFELSRLVVRPDVQKTEHNIASWFISRAIKILRKETKVKVILSYADEGHHNGTVYAASNFKYYGLTDSKSDFWIKQPDGSFIKHSRGATKNVDGVWLPRSRKHRFVIVYDNTLHVRWKEQKWVNGK